MGTPERERGQLELLHSQRRRLTKKHDHVIHLARQLPDRLEDPLIGDVRADLILLALDTAVEKKDVDLGAEIAEEAVRREGDPRSLSTDDARLVGV